MTTVFLYGIDEPDTRTALMKLELAIMKGQESAKKVARELEVHFDENGGIVTPAICRMQTRNNSVSSTPPIPIDPVSVINGNQEPTVAPAEVTTGETTSPVDEMVATENHALIPRPSTRPILCHALLKMRPLSISCAECSVVISCGKVDYDKSG
jgi:hypothetical protein